MAVVVATGYPCSSRIVPDNWEFIFFTVENDKLPEFFFREVLEPSYKVTRFHSMEVKEVAEKCWQRDEENPAKLFR